MAPIINPENETGVDEATLTGTGRGGILSDGYLRDDPLESYLDDDERPVFVLSNGKKGVAYDHLERDDSGRIRPGDGYRAFAMGTDSRLLFVIGDNEGRGDGDHSISVPLADIEVVEGSSGVLASELAVTTAADVCWRFPCSGGLSAAVEYLDSASMRWMDVERRLENARDAVVDATQALEERNYDDAIASVRTAMEETDAARRCERELCADGVASIDARIERMEERIRDVHVRTLEGRATHRMDVAETSWREGNYGEAHEAFTAAHDDYVEALAASETDFEGSTDHRERLARVERNLAALERAPVERADGFRSQAVETDDLAERGDLFEQALESYRAALELDWGRSAKRFECDTDEIRERIDAVAGDLVETRRRFAAGRVKRGDELAMSGRPERAAECYREAREALDRTSDLARELVPDAVEALTEHADAVESRLDGLDVPGADNGQDRTSDDERPGDEHPGDEQASNAGDGKDAGSEGEEVGNGGEEDGFDLDLVFGTSDPDDDATGDRRRRSDPDDDQTPLLGGST